MYYIVHDFDSNEDHELRSIPAVLAFLNANRKNKKKRNLGAKGFKAIMCGNGVFENQFKITKIMGKNAGKPSSKQVNLTPPSEASLPVPPMSDKPLPFKTRRAQKAKKGKAPIKEMLQTEDTDVVMAEPETAPIAKLTKGTSDPEGVKSNPVLTPQEKKKKILSPLQKRKMRNGRAARKFKMFLERRMEAKGAFNLDRVKANVQALNREVANMSAQDLVLMLIRVAKDMNTSIQGVLERLTGSVSHPAIRSQENVQVTNLPPTRTIPPRSPEYNALLSSLTQRASMQNNPARSDETPMQENDGSVAPLVSALTNTFVAAVSNQGAPINVPGTDLENQFRMEDTDAASRPFSETQQQLQQILKFRPPLDDDAVFEDAEGPPETQTQDPQTQTQAPQIVTPDEGPTQAQIQARQGVLAQLNRISQDALDRAAVESKEEEEQESKEDRHSRPSLPSSLTQQIQAGLQNLKRKAEEDRPPLPSSLMQQIQTGRQNLKRAAEDTGTSSQTSSKSPLQEAMDKRREALASTQIYDLRLEPKFGEDVTQDMFLDAAFEKLVELGELPKNNLPELMEYKEQIKTNIKYANPSQLKAVSFWRLVHGKDDIFPHPNKAAKTLNQIFAKNRSDAIDAFGEDAAKRAIKMLGSGPEDEHPPADETNLQAEALNRLNAILRSEGKRTVSMDEPLSVLGPRIVREVAFLLNANDVEVGTSDATVEDYINMNVRLAQQQQGNGPGDEDDDANPTSGKVQEVLGSATENQLDPELMPQIAHELNSFNISQLGENSPEDYYMLRTRMATPMELTGYAPMVREFALNMLVKPRAKAMVENMLVEVAASNKGESSLYVKYLNHLLFFLFKNFMKLPKHELGEIENDISNKYAEFFGVRGEAEDNTITSHIRMIVNEGTQKSLSTEPDVQDQLLQGAGALDFLREWEKGFTSVVRSTEGQEIEKELVARQRMARSRRRGHVLFDTSGSNNVRKAKYEPFKTPIDPALRRPDLDYKSPVSYTRRTPRIAVRQIGGPKRVQVPVTTMISMGDQRKPLEVPARRPGVPAVMNPDGSVRTAEVPPRDWEPGEAEAWYRNEAAKLDLKKSTERPWRELMNMQALRRRGLSGSGAVQGSGLRRRRGIALYADEGPERQAHKRLRKAFTLSMYNEK